MEIRLYASIVLINNNNETLLVQEKKEKAHKLWNFPGGKVEAGEHVVQAAIRETKEETGLDIEASHLLKIFYGKQFDSMHFVFLSSKYSGLIQNNDPNILDIQWFPLHALQEMNDVLLHPYKFAEVLKCVRENAVSRIDIIQ